MTDEPKRKTGFWTGFVFDCELMSEPLDSFGWVKGLLVRKVDKFRVN